MKTRHTLLFILLITLLSGGCTKNDSPEDSSVTRTLTISMRAPQGGSETNNELINSWWMVFVDKSNNIQLILDRPSDRSGAVSYEEVEFSIPRGTYDIYAFANIAKDNPELGLTTIKVGDRMPELGTKMWNRVGGINDQVPMTGKLEDVRFGNTASDSFTIEVVRLWAKLRFEFRTDTGEAITVKNISMTPANTDHVSLLPDYSTLGGAPNLPFDATCDLLSRGVTLNVPTNASESVSETFYLLESTAAGHPTKHYPLTFTLMHGGKEYKLNALAYQLEHINRNDFVTIPVLITDWKVDLNVLFYPPIGGYPAVLIDKNDSEFYARFGSGGKFVIRPTVAKTNGEQVTDQNLDITLTTSDQGGLLTGPVTRDPKTREIIGEIKDGVKGMAYVDLVIQIKDDALQHQILRRFYIIRQ